MAVANTKRMMVDHNGSSGISTREPLILPAPFNEELNADIVFSVALMKLIFPLLLLL
jgi:hypothetical protein